MGKGYFEAKAFVEDLKSKGWEFKPYGVARRSHVRKYWHFQDRNDPTHYLLHGPNDQPAFTDRSAETNVPFKEEWRFGKLHREGGPARIFRDRDTAVITGEDWFNWGRRHRTDGPATVKFDRVTGNVIYE